MRIAALVLITIVFISCSDDKYKSVSEYGHFAPADAFEEDSLFAYYGSENEWNRRMFSERAANNQYKRMGQRMLLFVLDGNPDRAVEECKKRLENHPDDLEALFVMTCAYSALNDKNSAWESAKLAMEKGLQIERFIAGPRDLLKSLYEHSEYKSMLADKNIKLLHGPMLGAITDSSAKIWIRTAVESDLVLELFDKLNDKYPHQIIGSRSRSEDDYTTVLEINGLEEGTKYFFDLTIDGEKIITRKPLSTFSEKKDNVRIAFGGGAGYTPNHEKMWSVIQNNIPDALFLLGDNVYIDLPEMPGNFHDYTYYRRQSEPRFRSLVSSVPVYSIWDDHDSGTDDVWLGPYLDKPKWKLPLLNHFTRQWVNPSSGEDGNPGCYYRFSIGQIDLFMLDCRFYRTNPFKEEKTMIGPKQKQWLKTEILKSTGKFKLLVSSVPWSTNSKPGSRDTWDGFSEEREEIFSFLEQNKIEGIVLVAADRHRSDAWMIERQNGYDLYEFQSSKLTNMHTHNIMPESIIGYNEKCSFGQLDFSLSLSNPELKYSIVNIDGEIIDSIKISHSELKY